MYRLIRDNVERVVDSDEKRDALVKQGFRVYSAKTSEDNHNAGDDGAAGVDNEADGSQDGVNESEGTDNSNEAENSQNEAQDDSEYNQNAGDDGAESDYDKMDYKELCKVAKEKGIQDYSHMKKPDLLAIIKAL